MKDHRRKHGKQVLTDAGVSTDPEQMARSVVDRIERKLEELPSLDYVDSSVQPGHAIMIVSLGDSTPPGGTPLA